MSRAYHVTPDMLPAAIDCRRPKDYNQHLHRPDHLRAKVARRRVVVGVRAVCLLTDLRKAHPEMRPSWIYWRVRLGEPDNWGVVCMAHLCADNRKRFWKWHLVDREHNPAFYFMGFPTGGTLVVPTHALRDWRKVRITAGSRSDPIWRYWERWDLLTAYPKMPADLVVPDALVVAAHAE